MFRRKVTAPDGRTWTLGRRWMPRYRRIGRADPGDVAPDVPDLGGDDTGILAAIVLAIFAVIAAVFIALVLFNVVAIAIELLLIVVLFVAGVVGRVVFRRPWVVFAAAKNASFHEVGIVGWRASRREIDRLAGLIASGAELEPASRDRG